MEEVSTQQQERSAQHAFSEDLTCLFVRLCTISCHQQGQPVSESPDSGTW